MNEARESNQGFFRNDPPLNSSDPDRGNGFRSQGSEVIDAETEATKSAVTEKPVQPPASAETGIAGGSPLFRNDHAQQFRSQWTSIQASFVDEPRNAVQMADNLVGGVISRLTETFTGERDKLEKQWEKGNDASTEDLRRALQNYRSFFTRLLSV